MVELPHKHFKVRFTKTLEDIMKSGHNAQQGQLQHQSHGHYYFFNYKFNI